MEEIVKFCVFIGLPFVINANFCGNVCCVRFIPFDDIGHIPLSQVSTYFLTEFRGNELVFILGCVIVDFVLKSVEAFLLFKYRPVFLGGAVMLLFLVQCPLQLRAGVLSGKVAVVALVAVFTGLVPGRTAKGDFDYSIFRQWCNLRSGYRRSRSQAGSMVSDRSY